MVTSDEIRNKLGAQASELLEWIQLIEKNFTSLKKSPCHVRIEEFEPFSLSRLPGQPSWRVHVFQQFKGTLEIIDMRIHTYEDEEGRSLKDVLQEVFLHSCQESASV